MVMNQADRYVARLFSGQVNQADEQEIASWKQHSTNHGAEYDAAVEYWASLEGLADDADIMALCDLDSGSKNSKSWRGSYWNMAIAASIVMAVVMAGMWIFSGANQDQRAGIVRYVTTIGEQKSVPLPDGSTMIMNTSSRVLVDYTSDYRRTIVDRGEVFFDVAKDPQRPFVVEAGDRAFTVLGTQFNVRKLPDRTLVLAVSEGAVGIHYKGELATPNSLRLSNLDRDTRNLVRSDQCRVDSGWVAELDPLSNQVVAYAPQNIERFSSWRDGSVRFDREPLSNVIKEMNRYSGKKILVEDAAIMNLKVNAVFKTNQVDTALTGLEASLPIKVYRYVDRYVITAKSP